MEENINLKDTEQQLKFFGHKLFWFHVFKPTKKGQQQKGDLFSAFCNSNDVLKYCSKYNGAGILCVAINERPKDKTLGSDVTSIKNLVIDLDVRKELKKNHVSLEEDHKHAISLAKKEIIPFLEGKGFNADMLVDSGNGCHLFLKVDIDISTEDKRKIFTEKISQLESELRKFSDDIVEVDFITKDINRRIKLAGTINKKDLFQSEDRLSKILFVNENIDADKNTQAFNQIQCEAKGEPIKAIVPEVHAQQQVSNYKEILQNILSKDLKLKQLLIDKDYSQFGNDRSSAEASIVEKLIFYKFSKPDVFEIMKECAEKWNEKSNSYKEMTFSKAFDFAKNKAKENYEFFNGVENQIVPEQKESKKEEIEFQYQTKHLPHFDELKKISALEGQEYIPILKGCYYSLIGMTIRDKKIRVGKLKTDTRISLTIPLPSGQGKKNIKNTIYKIFKKCNYQVFSPLSFHSQQLIGKVVNRGSFKKPCWLKNEGFLIKDYLLFDEAFKLYTSRDEEIQESRRAIRIAKDLHGENLVEKKQVDNTFDDAERISYYPRVTIAQFLQPKNLPSDVVEEGDLRRDLILYVRGISDRDKTNDFKNRLKIKNDDEAIINSFCDFLVGINSHLFRKEFSFTEEAIEFIAKFHLDLVNYGFQHSEKGANFTKMVDWTSQDFLVKLSCCNAAIRNQNQIDVNIVKLAFMDMLEFFDLQLNFVQDKINGKLDYGDGWNGARETDQQCLQWLWEQGAKDEASSKITINLFKIAIGKIKGVGYNESIKNGQALRYYQKYLKNNWIGSKQIGQHDSRVWINFIPKSLKKINDTDEFATSYYSILEELPQLIETSKTEDNPANPKTFDYEKLSNFFSQAGFCDKIAFMKEFGIEAMTKMAEDGTIYENPSGTLRLKK